MGQRPSEARRRAAFLALAAHLGALVLVPALHLVDHRADHVHGAALEQLDWMALRDAQTGRIDLERLAGALGLEDGDHRAAHEEGRAHDHHEQGPVDQPAHGAGASEHFAALLLTPVARTEPAWRPTPVVDRSQAREEIRRAPSHPFLSAQQAQGPPEVA